ncbi:MAG: hypothetical protein JKY43_03115 [Phycisphaerales bacterium]|nr:hypothetical protein [Phycisphaerales bacterium]
MGSCFGKTIVRGVVITALAGGVLVAVAGPQRVGYMIHQTKANVIGAIDSNIEDPIMLRAQIKNLEAQYPQKIAEVRSDLTEVQTQISQLDRELQVAVKVVALAASDLQTVSGQLTQARYTQEANPGAIVRVSFNNKAVDIDDAYAKRNQIQQTRDMYAARATDLQTDLGYLNDQELQLAELLNRLESERSEFQAKLFQLDAQIDTIARNERLIDMMEDRQDTINAHSTFQANSLDQLNGRLSSIRTEQRARLEAIAGRDADKNYVDEAEFLIDQEGLVQEFDNDMTLGTPNQVRGFNINPQIIEITPDTPKTTSPLASN